MAEANGNGGKFAPFLIPLATAAVTFVGVYTAMDARLSRVETISSQFEERRILDRLVSAETTIARNTAIIERNERAVARIDGIERDLSRLNVSMDKIMRTLEEHDNKERSHE